MESGINAGLGLFAEVLTRLVATVEIIRGWEGGGGGGPHLNSGVAKTVLWVFFHLILSCFIATTGLWAGRFVLYFLPSRVG